MTGKLLCVLTTATGLALAACASTAQLAKEAAMSTAEARSSTNMMPVKDWPLRFKRHKFSVFTYDTYGARVTYAGQVQINEPDSELQRSSASYGSDYQRNWSGIHGMIPNFPRPLEATWRSKNGAAHEASIDFGELFKDEVVRHNVAREDMADLPDGEYSSEPAIVVEINDRTIRVYMRAMVLLKRRVEIAGVMRAASKYELVLVKTYAF